MRTASSEPRRRVAAIAGALGGFLVLLVTVLVTGGLDPVDSAALSWAISLRSPWLTTAAQLVTRLGSTPVVVAVALLAALLLRRRTARWASSAVLVATVAVTDCAVHLLKVAVARHRPPVDTLIGVPAADFSFPSGHAANGGVAYLLVTLLVAETLASPRWRRLLVSGGVLVGVAVGLSRVYLGYHWVTDVLAGWCFAAAVALTAALVVRRLDARVPPRPGVPARRPRSSAVR